MMAEDKLNTPLAVEADEARIARDGEDDTATMKVKALEPVTVAGKTHKAGSTFTAPEPSVRDAIARGLLEEVAKR